MFTQKKKKRWKYQAANMTMTNTVKKIFKIAFVAFVSMI